MKKELTLLALGTSLLVGSGCVTYFGPGSSPEALSEAKRNEGIWLNLKMKNAQRYRNHTQGEALLLAGVAACNFLDYHSTAKLLDSGFYEKNPIFGKAPKKSEILAGKLIQTLISYLGGQFLSERRNLIYGAGVTIGCSAAASNYNLIGKGGN